jgi:two-component system chemotaxis response regulator CheB
MNTNPAPSLIGQTPARKIKVLIIDDSVVIRSLMSRWLSAEADLDVVGTASDGEKGIARARELQPDIIVLDIEMPVKDGITALPDILSAAPGVRVIMASTLTRRGGEVTIKALAAGASDYLAKPEATQLEGAADYKRDLLMKVRMLGASAMRAARHARGPAAVKTDTRKPPIGLVATKPPVKVRSVTLKSRPKVVVIGSSTGGPEALKTVIMGLVGQINVPVLITQHMPPLFTKILAEHLTKQTGANVIEAEHGIEAKPGTFYIGVMRLELNENPPENFCRPAVDPLFRSAAAAVGDMALAVVLTGMGHDGREGAKALVAKGAALIAQDEDTSVVWGMPGAVVRAGLASASKPISDIAPAILNVMRGVAL